jgi:hypothetical protein|tara:strand:+ start:223 stop:666 length:444 start_codon:yes stop_codon:yes gene_type:complete
MAKSITELTHSTIFARSLLSYFVKNAPRFARRSLGRIRYRICKLARDIIQLDEILGYLLEALEIIEIPPEPPEQAGRSLYERLEISGMRSQLVRRTTDLKKNIAGSQRYLDVLRERAHVVSEGKVSERTSGKLNEMATDRRLNPLLN